MKKIYLLFICCIAAVTDFAQVVVINPATTGGFESGTTFAANGWTVANGAANQWAVGTGSIFAGTRGAYIGTTTTYVGTNAIASNHFYIPVTLPATATNVQLTFQYKQPTVDNGRDSLTVSTVASTSVPVAGASASGLTGYNRLYLNTATAYTTYTLIGPLNLNALAGTSFNLVFSHGNNGSNPIGAPAVDNISLTYCNKITGSGTVCLGTPTTLSDVTTGGAWTSSASGVATVNSSGVVNGVSSGTATITYTAGTCVMTQVVTVNAQPTAITGTTPICTNNTATYTDAVAGGTWASSNAAVASVVSGTGVISALSAGTTNITYSIGGCLATKVLTVNASPSVFNVTGGGGVCAGGTGVNIGLSGSETAAISYVLYNGASPVTTVNGTTAAFNFGSYNTAGTYTVMATNTVNGCTTAMSGNAIVFITPPVVPSVTIASSIVPGACAGTAGTYTANPVNGGTSPSYAWSVNGVSAGVTTSTYNYAPAIGDVITVDLTTGGICASPTTASASRTDSLTNNEIPFVTVTVSPGNPICEGSLATFLATGTFGGTAPTYRWTKNGINVATGPTFSYVPTGGDDVYCKMLSNYVCRLADSVFSSHVVMVVNAPIPAPAVTIVANPGTHISAGQTDSLVAVVTSTGPVPTYQWYINGVAVVGATNALYVSNGFVNHDIVSCKVTNTDACATSTFTSVTINVGTTGMAVTGATADYLSVLPNPNNGVFRVYGSFAAGNDVVSVTVSNMLGQTIYSDKANTADGKIDKQIGLGSNLPNGMYLLELRSADEHKTLHFMIAQ